jgi:nicotinate-nucleotide adenylyltransferase
LSSGKKQAQDKESARPPQAAPGMRIGLLGGSFNPPHEAHRAISLEALRRLKLDRVWWLVAPRNPLKDSSALPSLEARVEAARELARHPRIDTTSFSGGSVYTADVLAALKRRFPGVRFVWLMGADNLPEFHRWRDFEDIFARVPIAVFDRPGYRLKARASRAARRFADYRVDETDAGGLADLIPPAWT